MMIDESSLQAARILDPAPFSVLTVCVVLPSILDGGA